MNTDGTRKAEGVKKCLMSLQRLGMDLAGLYSLNLNLDGAEQKCVSSALAYVDVIARQLNRIGREKIQEPELVEEREAKQNRTRGSVKF
jgi:hypothetical protein